MFNKKIIIAGLTILLLGGCFVVSKANTKSEKKDEVIKVEESISDNKTNKVEDNEIVDNKTDDELKDTSDKNKADTVDEEKNLDKTNTDEDKDIIEENKPVEEEKEKEEETVVKEKRTNLNNFLFVGDSFTVRIKRHITANNSDVYVHAKSSTMPSYWLDKVAEMPNNDKVDGVCLLIGVNGASRPQNLVDTKELINKLIAKYPDKKIYVQKVFPVGSNFENANPDKFNNSIKTYNTGLKEFCKTKENVYFIDTTNGFVDNNGYLIKDSGDGLHISESYDKEFYKNIEKEILNLINN